MKLANLGTKNIPKNWYMKEKLINFGRKTEGIWEKLRRQAFFSAFGKKLDLPRKSKTSIFPPKKTRFHNFLVFWPFLHQKIAINYKISPKKLISDLRLPKKQKFASQMQKIDLKWQKLYFEGQKLDFPAFYLNGFKCICAKKKSLEDCQETVYQRFWPQNPPQFWWKRSLF